MIYGEEVDSAPARLVKIIDLIFDKDPSAVVIVAQIPMMGIRDKGSTWVEMQRRVVSYNAAIAAIVNRMVQEDGRRILKVHTSTTTWEHREGTLIMPNGSGYLRMAYDFLEGIAMANAAGWLDERWVFVGTAVPASTGAAVTAGSTPAFSTSSAAIGFNSSAATKTVLCSQARPTDAPDLDNITNSLFEGLSQLDFVLKVACNETLVCNNSPNSNASSIQAHFGRQHTLTVLPQTASGSIPARSEQRHDVCVGQRIQIRRVEPLSIGDQPAKHYQFARPRHDLPICNASTPDSLLLS